MKFKKTLSALVACLYVLLMCVGCSSDNAGSNQGGTVTDSDKNNTNKNDSNVTDNMDELKDDVKDTADDVKDSLMGENGETSDGGAMSGRSMTPANNANNVNRQ